MKRNSRDPVNFFWFRRDLRLEDNCGLWHALQSKQPVQCLFIFDRNILDKLEDKQDRRLVFILRRLEKLNEELKGKGAFLMTRYGKPEEIWKDLIAEYKISGVYTNHDYEPYARERDEKIKSILEKSGIDFNTYKDQVVFEKDEVLKADGTPYTVYTPFKNKWRSLVAEDCFKNFDTTKSAGGFHKAQAEKMLSLKDIGFDDFDFEFPEDQLDVSILKEYEENRNLPAIKGTSQLSMHLRFGSLSVRSLYRKAWEKSEQWCNELIWREFFMYLLWHFPYVTEKAFNTKYRNLQWKKDEAGFEKWCKGMTGYPLVDAGMRELNETGLMHNRVRMVTAMFLTKYLLIDWAWGEAYFAKKLLDFELSSNNGNWQWCAGTGADAAPYFRIFNMDTQAKNFDPDEQYIRKWVKEYGTEEYPEPMVDYAFARKRCLEFFSKI